MSLILDSHVHCGLTLKFEIVKKEWDKAQINGGVIFSPVEEIYDRNNPDFYDSEFYQLSRQSVHNYLLELCKKNPNLYAFYFVWNDFKFPTKNFKGIKWHRHSYEPKYDYDNIKCKKLIDYICQQKLPIILEEEFSNTIEFISKINKKTVIIIPHLGMLNGGYAKLKIEDIFQESNIWVDTALANENDIIDYVKNYGDEKILFGSDFPFGSPKNELTKIKKIFQSKETFEKITYKNLKRLIKI